MDRPHGSFLLLWTPCLPRCKNEGMNVSSGPMNLDGIFGHLRGIALPFRPGKTFPVFPADERTVFFKHMAHRPCLFVSPDLGASRNAIIRHGNTD